MYKRIIIFTLAITLTYFSVNYFIGKDNLNNLKTYVGTEQKEIIKRYIFPQKFISQKEELLSMQRKKVSKIQNQILEGAIESKELNSDIYVEKNKRYSTF
jgi:hypothetical protein